MTFEFSGPRRLRVAVLVVYHPRSDGGIVFSSVCLCVCLSVCQRDNSLTVRDIIMKSSGYNAMVERADTF